jgi:hypothetical protein
LSRISGDKAIRSRTDLSGATELRYSRVSRPLNAAELQTITGFSDGPCETVLKGISRRYPIQTPLHNNRTRAFRPARRIILSLATIYTDTSAPAASEPASLALVAAESLQGNTYLDELMAHGLLVSTGVDGVYGRNAIFESVVEGVSNLIGRWGQDRDVEVLRFPPAMSRELLEQSGYLKNFPDQVGTVFTFCGGDAAHGRLLKCLDRQEDWTEELRPARIVMTPVACYPVYPVMGARGPLPASGRTIDIFSYCFRHEPSLDPERMQLFRQREFVRMGTEDEIHEFRAQWFDYAKNMFASLELPASIAVANDPFFGRGGKIVADSQRQQQLKFELVVPLINPDKPTACGSFNYHTDRFGRLWNILTDRGEIAHTGCVGFGLERVTLSLFKQHGFDPKTWPPGVRATLWPTLPSA